MTTAELAKTDAETLETLVDRYSVSAVVAALSTMAYEKAEHVQANWQDSGLAKAWDRAGNKLATAAVALHNIATEVL